MTLAGPLPAAIQIQTVYAGSATAGSAQPEAARAFLAGMTEPEARSAILAHGLTLP